MKNYSAKILTIITILLLIIPIFSSKVITSATSWQGWVSSLRPFMTGTEECLANSYNFFADEVL